MPASFDNVLKEFLGRIKRLKVEYAQGALLSPPEKTEFGFGQVCGVYEGLTRAEQLFKEVIGEDEDRT